MRVPRFLLTVSCATLCALLYVWQQTEIFRLGYAGSKKAVVCQELLDRNHVLRYNIERSSSLVRLGTRIDRDSSFVMPDTYRLVRLGYSRDTQRATRITEKKESLAFRIFGIKRQAEAKTINP